MSMDCRKMEALLEDLLDRSDPEVDRAGESPLERCDPEIRREAERHLGSCADCRDLIAVIVRGVGGAEKESPIDLTSGVLALTTGPVCGSARDRLPDRIDGALGKADGALLAMHLEHCRSCSNIASVLAWMPALLSEMAEVPPDPAFVGDVLRATTRRPARAWLEALRAAPGRLRDIAVRRPRFAFEAAYAGALVIWLLAGASFAPFRGVTDRVLPMTRFQPSHLVEASSVPLPSFLMEPADAGVRLWDMSGNRLLERTRPTRVELAGRLRQVGRHARSAGGHALRAAGEAATWEMTASAMQIDATLEDLRRLWRALSARGHNDESEQRTRGGHDGRSIGTIT